MSDLDDLVEQWHTSPDDDGPLHEFLGMTWEQYAEWTRTGIEPGE